MKYGTDYHLGLIKQARIAWDNYVTAPLETSDEELDQLLEVAEEAECRLINEAMILASGRDDITSDQILESWYEEDLCG